MLLFGMTKSHPRASYPTPPRACRRAWSTRSRTATRSPQSSLARTRRALPSFPTCTLASRPISDRPRLDFDHVFRRFDNEPRAIHSEPDRRSRRRFPKDMKAIPQYLVMPTNGSSGRKPALATHPWTSKDRLVTLRRRSPGRTASTTLLLPMASMATAPARRSRSPTSVTIRAS